MAWSGTASTTFLPQGIEEDLAFITTIMWVSLYRTNGWIILTKGYIYELLYLHHWIQTRIDRLITSFFLDYALIRLLIYDM